MQPLKQVTRAAAVLALTLAASPALAMTYAECVGMIDRAPGDAYSAALAWTKVTDDPGAQHCTALAEVALKRYGAAADRLNRLIDQTGNQYESAALLGQLGNVRMLDGKPDLAVRAFDRALGVTPNDAQLLADRARAYAALKQWPKAVRDLDAATQIEDDDPELMLLFATALRELGKLPEARTAADKALALAPKDPAVLLERGRIRLLAGDRDGAKADWQTALAAAPKGDLRDTIAASLKTLETKTK